MEDFEKYLMDKYPTLFRKDEEGNLRPPDCGIYCPAGWKSIVDKLCQCIYDYTTLTYRFSKNEDGSFNKEYPPKIYIDQIKSKFGGLRFYFSGGDDEVNGMVRFAEHLCSYTCENTGEPGSIFVKNGWYSTLSDSEKERLSEKNP